MTLVFGTQTGSLANHILSVPAAVPTPSVGMGATLLGWTDRYAATVVSVKDGIISLREDRAERLDQNGQSDTQLYAYTPDPDGMIHHYRRKNGAWERVEFNEGTKRWTKSDGYGLRLGVRDHYYDYSF